MGADAVSVNKIVGGPLGWLITGSRKSGAAVWESKSARRFHLVQGRGFPAGGRVGTATLDAIPSARGWIVVGTRPSPSIVRAPTVWVSDDGRNWQTQGIEANRQYGTMERVTRMPQGLVAVGLVGSTFGSWRRDGDADEWQIGPAFAPFSQTVTAAPFVSGLASSGSTVLAAVSGNTQFGLWQLRDSEWRPLDTPQRVSVTGDHTMTVAANSHEVLLITDDGSRSRVWFARSD